MALGGGDGDDLIAQAITGVQQDLEVLADVALHSKPGYDYSGCVLRLRRRLQAIALLRRLELADRATSPRLDA